LGVRGLNKKIERFIEGSWRTGAKKWLDSIEKQKRRINLKFVTDRQTDTQTESMTKNNRLLG